jgi:ubiquinone/menaquinone biosynthesis C-methylase UbiE
MMSTNSRHDAWSAGDSYDQYMGRWSRQIAPQFLEWLGLNDGRDWLEVGCGTGALSAEILARCQPGSQVCIDPSEGFIKLAMQNAEDPRVNFRVGNAQDLPFEDSSYDVVVSALVLNFIPDRHKAMLEMRRVCRPGGIVAFYVWDYPGGGIEFMRKFWNAAISLDPSAADLAENKRFPFCTREGLTEIVQNAGLRRIEVTPIEVNTIFRNFDDFWQPFTLGAGPAPGYCASLDPSARERLREKLRHELTGAEAGSITLKARAWAVRTRVD